LTTLVQYLIFEIRTASIIWKVSAEWCCFNHEHSAMFIGQ